jgi:hypothetical protein
MSYTPTVWKSGDVISSEKLNKIENGIEAVGIETNIQNPTDGQTLKYDAASGKWVNGEGGGSSTLVVTSTYDESTQIVTLDKTWQEIYDALPNVMILHKEDDVADLEIPLHMDFIESTGEATVHCVSFGVGSKHTYTSSSKTGVLTDNGGGGGGHA